MARKRVPKGQFRQESVLSGELPPCVAVAAVGEVLNYLFDAHHSWEGVRQVLQRAYGALAPGGLLLFDVAGPGRASETGSRRAHALGDDWAVMVTVEEEPQHAVLTRDITSFRKAGELYRRDHEVHRQRLLHPDQALSWLRETGFRAQPLDSYQQRPFPAGLAGFLARKPG